MIFEIEHKANYHRLLAYFLAVTHRAAHYDASRNTKATTNWVTAALRTTHAFTANLAPYVTLAPLDTSASGLSNR